MATNTRGGALLLATLACLGAVTAVAATTERSARTERFVAERAERKSSTLAKLGPGLGLAYRSSQSIASPNGKAARTGLMPTPAQRVFSGMLGIRNGSVRVEAIAKGDVAGLRRDLIAQGMTNVKVAGNRISGRLPVTALAKSAANPRLQSLRPSLWISQSQKSAAASAPIGITESQGVRALRADLAREQFGVTGNGIKVGVMSDSYDCVHAPLTDDPEAYFSTALDDIENNDLPAAGVEVLADLPEPDCSAIASDEGRAMLQIVHDVAPDASLAFHTASVSEADFADGILALADAGAKVIVDDIIYLTEPMFQDGVIAQAVDRVRNRGVAYFSAAGNQGRQSYESEFRLSDDVGLSGRRHDFDPRKGTDTLQRIGLDADATEILSLQWDDPFASLGGTGSRADIDILFYDLEGNLLPSCDDLPTPPVCQYAGVDANIDADPVELALASNTSGAAVEVQLGIELYDGDAPRRIKYVYFDVSNGFMQVRDFDTQSGTIYGHANAAGAEAVGAAGWYNTQIWSSPLWGKRCNPACTEIFSGTGGVNILFDDQGRRLRKPQPRYKPGIVGPDGGNSTFLLERLTNDQIGGGEPDIYPNFFGTSAAAPHVAGVAALLLEQMDNNTRDRRNFRIPEQKKPDYLYWILRATAQDMRYKAGQRTAPAKYVDGGGFDADSGFGFVDTVRALRSLKGKY